MGGFKQSQYEVMYLISRHPRSARELALLLERTEHCVRKSLRDLQDRGLAWISGNIVANNRQGPLSYKWAGLPPPKSFRRMHMITPSKLANISRDLLLWLQERGVHVATALDPSTGEPQRLFLAASVSSLLAGQSIPLPVEIPARADDYESAICERTEWVLLPDVALVQGGDRVVIRESCMTPVQEVIAGSSTLGRLLLGATTRSLSESLVNIREGGEVLVYRPRHRMHTPDSAR